MFDCFKGLFKSDDSSDPSFSSDFIDDVEDIEHYYENLVFEGGGVKGLSLAAAVVELDKLGILDDIKRFAGSSAGAIIASGLAIGYSPREIVDIMVKTDFKEFLDDTQGMVRDVNRLVKKYGYYKGKYFLEWVRYLIEDKTGDQYYTFKNLWSDKRIELVITGTNLNLQRTEYFSHKTHPDMPIAVAVRISMSLPFLFVPYKYGDCLYVDGGMLCNYPIDVFGEGNEHTLGFKMVGDDEVRSDHIQEHRVEIENVKEFSSTIINILLLEIERRNIKDNYWKRTITINTGHVSTADFDLSKEDLEFLYQRGKEAVQKRFKYGSSSTESS